MIYIEASRVVANTILSPYELDSLISSFGLVKYKRKKTSVKKILADDLGLIVMCSFLVEKGFSVKEITGLTKQNIKRLTQIL